MLPQRLFGQIFTKCGREQTFLFHTSPVSSVALYPYYNIHKKVTDPARQDPEYFEKKAGTLPLDSHYLDSLKGLWEEKIGSERELGLKASDSLVGNTTDYGLPQLDLTAPRIEYQHVDALKDAPESVKKIYSIDYGERRDLTFAWKKALYDQVGLHTYDRNSLQARIAWATVCIRHWTALMDEMTVHIPGRKRLRKPKWLMHRLLMMVNYRRKILRFLREENSEEFERVLKELKIAYHVEKPPEHVKTRKAWSEAQLRRRVEREKEKMLSELHKTLMDGRVERTAKLEAELEALEKEQAKIEAKLTTINELEGKTTRDVRGVYQPKYVEELAEIVIHQQLFYFKPPQKNL